MLTVKITIRSDGFEFQGEAPFSDVVTLINQFYVAITTSSEAEQARVDADAAKIAEATTTLSRVAQTLDDVAPNT